MGALTGQEVVSEIAKRLRSRFSDKEFAEIYKDKPVQSMKTPCIFLHSVETSHTPELRRYAWWNHMIDIRCHPGRVRTDIQTWARSLGPLIVECIEHITINNQQVKATNISWRVEDDVLHVTTTYRYRVVQASEEIPDITTLKYGARIKE